MRWVARRIADGRRYPEFHVERPVTPESDTAEHAARRHRPRQGILGLLVVDVLRLDRRDLIATPLDERREVLATVLKGSRLLRSDCPLRSSLRNAGSLATSPASVAARGCVRLEATDDELLPPIELHLHHVRAELFAALKAIEQPRCPFSNLPSSKTGHWGEGIAAEDMAALRWVKPKIVVEVSFVEWTRDAPLPILIHELWHGVGSFNP
jgi:hypothetical protein